MDRAAVADALDEIGTLLELLGENPLNERIVASPTPAENRLFVRGDNNLFCIAGK